MVRVAGGETTTTAVAVAVAVAVALTVMSLGRWENAPSWISINAFPSRSIAVRLGRS